ncbi:hypothetical protein LLB_2487 [Legionella longbeachae D-4968]|nr:hypothetical protein LLB_2487 [Legionella longbeachae D-4968]
MLDDFASCKCLDEVDLPEQIDSGTKISIDANGTLLSY